MRERTGDSIEQLREDVFAVGTLGALNFVVRGLRDLPGRKSVILFSDGFTLFRRDGGASESNQRILESLRRLTDLANRASVVVYTIDARGLQTLGATAADQSLDPQEMARKLNERKDEFYDTQEGLNYLANETGGLFIRNTNDLNRGIGRVLEDQKGYYLLGYVPESSTFRVEKGLRKFHKFNVKVKRAGLKVRTRTGFFGIADEERPAQRTPAQQLFSALISPFASGDIHLKLTSVFGHEAKGGPFVSSMLHIEGKDLTLAAQEGGFHQGIVNIAAVTFSDNGRVVDQNNRAYTLRVNDEQYQKILKQGFLYTIVVPVKKPGAYQLRVAVRDDASERVGAANQFIEVPDISKNRLALSGIIASGSDPSELNKPQTNQASASNEGAVESTNPQASPSMRKLRSGMILDYVFVIYNAQLDRATAGTQLESQVILLRDGKPVFTGNVSPIEIGQQPDLKHITAGGRMQLGTNMEPGEYILQVIVTDKLAKEKYNTATQWIDFEVVK